MSVRLYATPVETVFGRGDEQRLLEWVEPRERDLLYTPPVSVQHLQLGADGRTLRGGYQYTQRAFKQVAALASPYLFAVLEDLAGPDSGLRTYSRSMYDLQTVVDVFNRVVALRFPAVFSALRMVIDRGSSQLLGVVEKPELDLSHARIVLAVNRRIQELPDEVLLDYARVCGRELLLRYVTNDPVGRGPLGEELHTGYYLAARGPGRASIAGGRTLYRPLTDSAALQMISGCVIPRSGQCTRQQVSERCDAALAQVFQRVWTHPPFPEAVARLQEQSLEIPATVSPLLTQRINQICVRMRRYHILLRITNSVVRRAVYCGGNTREVASVLTPQQHLDFPKRTLYDLYNSLGIVGAQLSVATRERLESAAYSMLMGKFKLK